ncbi:hypothetical protein [Massilia sp. TS11]|uniref:Vgb family protein n=1 Tax=Massilia sp. TS11 TaxID=2908003 RepID=UPI001EDA8E4C|nr:hypothetical protein [Massilia sp. TS11]MCG2583220.1 hypothetical protein [Massilia sp. TS11]
MLRCLALFCLLAGASVHAEPLPPLQPLPPGTRAKAFDIEADWLAISPGTLWLAGYEPGEILALDPDTLAVRSRASTGGTSCQSLTVALGRIWAANCSQGELVGVGLASGQVERRIPLPFHPKREGAIAEAGGLLWAVVGQDENHLVAVAPETGAIVHRLALPAESNVVVAGFGALWISSTRLGLVTRVDPATARVVASIPVGPTPKYMAVGEGMLWITNIGDTDVWQVDPASNRLVRQIPIGLAPEAKSDGGDLTTYGGAVWKAVKQRPITRIDAASGRVTLRIENGQEQAAIRIGHGALYVTDWKQKILYRIPLAALQP